MAHWAGLSKCPSGMNLAHDIFRVGTEAQNDFGSNLLAFEEGIGLELDKSVKTCEMLIKWVSNESLREGKV